MVQHGLRFHQYADDSQIQYISTTVSEEALAVQRFTACAKAIIIIIIIPLSTKFPRVKY